MFGLWDNVYHQNAIKSLDGVGRWDPTQASKTMPKKKREAVETSSDESEDSDEDGDDKEDGDEDKDDKSEEEEEVFR